MRKSFKGKLIKKEFFIYYCTHHIIQDIFINKAKSNKQTMLKLLPKNMTTERNKVKESYFKFALHFTSSVAGKKSLRTIAGEHLFPNLLLLAMRPLLCLSLKTIIMDG